MSVGAPAAPASVEIRPARAGDAEQISSVYNHYVSHGIATFEETAVPPEEMARRITETLARFPWLVAESEGVLAGYAYAGPWKTRASYRFTAETTVYLRPESTRRGIGTALYRPLLDALRGLGLHAAVACIALPNAASIALHERLGFEEVGRLREVGFKLGRWIDVGYWARPL